MVDLEILKEKIQKVSTLIGIVKGIVKGIGLVIIVMNVLGLVYDKIEFTISLSLIVIILFWLWTLDSQVSRIEKSLKGGDKENEK